MKLILVLGTSLSAAFLAVGFAMFANQALSRESDMIGAPKPILPSRVAPDLLVNPGAVTIAHRASFSSTQTKAASAALPIESPTLASVATSGNAAIPAASQTSNLPDAGFVPLLGSALAERPPRRPVVIAFETPTQVSAPIVTGVARIPASSFENLPLIGVYR